MSSTSKTVGRALRGILAGGLLAASAATMIALPVASAACNGQTVGNSIDSYLKRHPEMHRQLQSDSKAEGGNGTVVDYLNRHPDFRQHLIDLSAQCAP